MKDLSFILNPKSIAVVGASNRPGSVGRAVFSNILKAEYQGVLYPVNPNATAVLSVKAYPSLLAVPGEVDLAVVIVKAPLVLDVVEDARKKGVKGLVVISAGFKEVGGEGALLEARLKELVSKYQIPLIGPNCLGIMNTASNVSLNASFAARMANKGNIAFVSQSGALCTAVLDFASARGIGFSKFISIGNKADVDETDVLEYLKDDPETKVILMYLEDITAGKRFMETAKEVTWTAKKPILVMKSGRSPEGAKAASSHTGSLAGSDSAYDAIFMQSGIQRVETIEDLFYYAMAFSTQPIPAGNRLAIITNAGGPGIVATDAAVRHGLKLAEFSSDTVARLASYLPGTASPKNPVDVIGDATHERYEASLKCVLEDSGVDGVLVILTPQAMTDVLETAQIVPRVASGAQKPVLCSFMGIVDVSEGVKFLQSHGFPNFEFPEAAIRAFAAMARFGELQRLEKKHFRRVAADREGATKIIQTKLAGRKRYFMPEIEANELLQCYGFPVLKTVLIKDESELEKAVHEVGFPLVMKVSSTDIVHKSDVGGVRLNINSIEEAVHSYRDIIDTVAKKMPQATIQGVIAQRMARKGVEVILGAARDPKFGPICMFGLGGVFIEAFQDVSFRLAPMWEASAERMIKSVKAYKILQGFRGYPPADIEAIKDCLLRLSQMVDEHPEIMELDINPLIVYEEGKGCVVADSRILLASL